MSLEKTFLEELRKREWRNPGIRRLVESGELKAESREGNGRCGDLAEGHALILREPQDGGLEPMDGGLRPQDGGAGRQDGGLAEPSALTLALSPRRGEREPLPDPPRSGEGVKPPWWVRGGDEDSRED